MKQDVGDLNFIPLDECCKCLSPDVTRIVRMGSRQYPFCNAHDDGAILLQRGQAAGWPALREVGITGTYAIAHDVQWWLLSALQGTPERNAELLDALYEYEQDQVATAHQ